ncbi:MAG: GNAT family N-acetyltransferase [Chloroflexi bacterium]|nr:GNAT family N-acetyltransferase [Chloroflexota bacterium]
MVRRSGEVKVRKMEEADLPRVNYIDGLLFGENRVTTWPFSFGVYWAVHNPKLSFVAEADGQVVGFVVGNISQEEHSQSIIRLMQTADMPISRKKTGWIDMIGVSPEYQRKGVGRMLVEAFYGECKRNNAIMRGVAKDKDQRLQKFLTDMGFKKSDVSIYEKK